MARSVLAVKAMLVLLAVLVVASPMAVAQEREGRGRRGGGFRFGGRRGGGVNATTLLRSEQVQKELGLKEDQIEKITAISDESRQGMRELFSGLRDLSEEDRRKRFDELRAKGAELSAAARVKVGELLSDSQTKRLDEILLQVRGPAALADDTVAANLALSDDQKGKIKDLLDTERELQQEISSGVRDLPREERQEKFAEIRKHQDELRKETEKAVLEVLTTDQNNQFAALKGAAFELDFSALGSGRFGRQRGEGRGGQQRRDRPRRPEGEPTGDRET